MGQYSGNDAIDDSRKLWKTRWHGRFSRWFWRWRRDACQPAKPFRASICGWQWCCSKKWFRVMAYVYARSHTDTHACTQKTTFFLSCMFRLSGIVDCVTRAFVCAFVRVFPAAVAAMMLTCMSPTGWPCFRTVDDRHEINGSGKTPTPLCLDRHTLAKQLTRWPCVISCMLFACCHLPPSRPRFIKSPSGTFGLPCWRLMQSGELNGDTNEVRLTHRSDLVLQGYRGNVPLVTLSGTWDLTIST